MVVVGTMARVGIMCIEMVRMFVRIKVEQFASVMVLVMIVTMMIMSFSMMSMAMMMTFKMVIMVVMIVGGNCTGD
jgi:hypothetical protein